MQREMGVLPQFRRGYSVLFFVRRTYTRTRGPGGCVSQWILLGHYHGWFVGNWGLCFPRAGIEGSTIGWKVYCGEHLGLGWARL